MFAKSLDLGGRKVGPGHPCFIIAEAGVNHNGSLDRALQLVDVAADSGADAVKFQTFKAELVATPDAPKAAYQKRLTGESESQYKMVQALELPFEDFRRIDERCQERGIVFLSSPFDGESVRFLERLGVEAIKIPSGEITNTSYLRQVAATGLPLFLSTGMCTLAEVDQAVSTIEAEGTEQLAVLHCVSNYPAAPSDTNLRAMRTMELAFDVPVGFSDHTPGTEVAMAAVALGACVIEKHFTLNKQLPGPDHLASLEPNELGALVTGIRNVESALGTGRKQPVAAESDTRNVARRSLVLTQDVNQGQTIEPDLLLALRPAGGVPPNLGQAVYGRKFARDLKSGTRLDWRDVA